MIAYVTLTGPAVREHSLTARQGHPRAFTLYSPPYQHYGRRGTNAQDELPATGLYHGEPPVSATMPLTEQEHKLAQLIVETLNLEVSADEIDPDAPLYGEGLGLDSIDILEMALAISKTYGVQLRSEDENNRKIFASLRRLNEHLQQHRAK